MLTPKARCQAVNGSMLRSFRVQLGWSQVELGHRSGYSERVIRKAEAGGSLRFQTIQDLAMTMSVNGQAVSFQDLTIDLESIARRFVESYDSLGCDMLIACSNIFADDFVFNFSADANHSAFAGLWQGISGFQEFLNRFFATFSREQGILQPVYMASQNRMVVRFEDRVNYHHREMSAYWVNLHFQFRNGLVTRIDDEFDSLNLSNSVERLQLVDEWALI